MPRTQNRTTPARRMALYRKKAKRSGRERFEVNLPAPDAELIRYAVDRIREGGTGAEQMRQALEHSKNPNIKVARSTNDLYKIFRNSPLVGLDLEFERDKSPVPDVSLF